MSDAKKQDIYRRTRGLSMLEVMLASFILIICAMTLLSASTSSGQATRQSSEYAAAVAAARRKMEDLCNTKDFSTLVTQYGSTNPTMGNTFKVYMNESAEYVSTSGVRTRGQELQGYYKLVNNAANYDAGEIVIITHESNPASSYGYKCQVSPSDTYPDGSATAGGVTFTGLPIDLTGDGNTTGGSVVDYTKTPIVVSAMRLPVGVIVRWQGSKGPERYELWTILGNY